MILIVTVFSI